MFQELNKIKGQDNVIEKIKMLVNTAKQNGTTVNDFIIFAGSEQKRIEIAKAFAADVEKDIYNNEQSVNDYYRELDDEENKARSQWLHSIEKSGNIEEFEENNKKYSAAKYKNSQKNICFFVSKHVVAISLGRFKNGGDFFSFLLSRNEHDIIILNDYEKTTNKQILDYIEEAILSAKATIKLTKGQNARYLSVDIPKFTFVFLCENDDERLNFIDYSFRLENSSLSDSKDYITQFFQKEGIIIADKAVDQIAELGYDFPKLRRKLIELIDGAFCKRIKSIDIDSLGVVKSQDYSIEHIDNMVEGFEFEKYAADLLKENGFYDVTVTKTSGDFGVDIIAYKDEIKYAIQCKKYSSPVGIDAIQQVIGSKTMFNCHVGVVLTNNYFTSAALRLAEKTNVLIWDRKKLINLIEKANKFNKTGDDLCSAEAKPN